MKTLVLFGSFKKLSNAHKPVHTTSQPPRGAVKQPPYFVRMKVVNQDDLVALNTARPRVGETLLNTIPVE